VQFNQKKSDQSKHFDDTDEDHNRRLVLNLPINLSITYVFAAYAVVIFRETHQKSKIKFNITTVLKTLRSILKFGQPSKGYTILNGAGACQTSKHCAL
jgi:hypothetical protein